MPKRWTMSASSPRRLHVFARALVAAQALAEVQRGPLHRDVELVVRIRRAGGGTAFARHLESRARGEFLDRLDEAEVVVFHDEAEHRAVRAAAEAVIELLVDADPERRRLLVVERAARLVFAPGLLQLHAAADHLEDVGAGDEFVDEVLGDAGHGAGFGRRVGVG